MMRSDTSSATGEVLQRDVDVDSMSEREVKDAFARSQLMHQIIRAHNPRWMQTDACDEVEEMLCERDADSLPRVLIHALGRDHPVTDLVEWGYGERNIDRLFDRLTPDGDTEAVEAARASLKETLRGSGMPRITVARARVDAHTSD